MKYLIGNWKMNPLSVEDARHMASEIDRGVGDVKDIYVGITAPFLFLSSIKSQMLHTTLGAQDVFWEKSTGAYTGEISPQQLLNLGVEFVILGHSERRIYLEELDEIITKKLKTALSSGLKVVLCVGEPSEVRKEGGEASKKYVEKQLKKDLSSVIDDGLPVGENLIVAYEPIWAISTFEGSEPAKPEDAEEMIAFIKEILDEKFKLSDIPVIYGGSTNAENVESFLTRPSIDGVLPGSASLDPEEFVEMIQIASEMQTE